MKKRPKQGEMKEFGGGADKKSNRQETEGNLKKKKELSLQREKVRYHNHERRPLVKTVVIKITTKMTLSPCLPTSTLMESI